MKTIIVWLLITTNYTVFPPFADGVECEKMREVIRNNGICRMSEIVDMRSK